MIDASKRQSGPGQSNKYRDLGYSNEKSLDMLNPSYKWLGLNLITIFIEWRFLIRTRRQALFFSMFVFRYLVRLLRGGLQLGDIQLLYRRDIP